MSNRRTFIALAAASIASGCQRVEPEITAPTRASFNPSLNTFAAHHMARGGNGRVARAGETWGSVFGDRALVAKYANRQNVTLYTGQAIVVPSSRATIADLNPFAINAETSASRLLVFDPQLYAWALYVEGRLVRWGPAVGGSDWCGDVSRPCRTQTGSFVITEVSGPDRRSNAYPPIAAAEGRGALMPYYMRITSGGIGFHARYIRGKHESHGCIGMFYSDAQWLNLQHARKGRVDVLVRAYA